MPSTVLPVQKDPVYRIPLHYYIHVLDQNTTLARLEVGPQKFFKHDNESIIFGPEKMIVLPPRHYCIVQNPVIKNIDGKPQYDQNGQVRLLHGTEDVGLEGEYKEPFPL